jgi:flagellar hook assembly protein FlgD
MLPYNERAYFGISFTPSSEGYKEAVLQIINQNNDDIIEINLLGMALQSTDNEDSEVQSLITKLGSNYPNPFNPETTINFSLKERGNVELNIYNIRGQKVKSLVSEYREAGNHAILWNGKDNNNKPVASGIYLYQMKNEHLTSTRKMILMK